ncbi:MAG: hypothetical protein KDA96_08245 [Planctomycetaceae bacterium]|nr:hypothetical protein [Planctomycetaceae bacterium]
MSPISRLLLFGQGPNPYGGGAAVVFLLFLLVMFAAVGVIVCVLRRLHTAPLRQKPPRQWLRRIAGFLLGCVIVAVTAFLIDVVTMELEFSERVEVSDNGRVTGVAWNDLRPGTVLAGPSMYFRCWVIWHVVSQSV